MNSSPVITQRNFIRDIMNGRHILQCIGVGDILQWNGVVLFYPRIMVLATQIFFVKTTWMFTICGYILYLSITLGDARSFPKLSYSLNSLTNDVWCNDIYIFSPLNILCNVASPRALKHSLFNLHAYVSSWLRRYHILDVILGINI